jgi:glycerophosphoryl diester phosphodiesterase
VFGHRGVRAEGGPPENTLAAFARAADEGADGFELDVRPCASGELVALHDPTLERVTRGDDRRAAADLAYDELRRVDLGGGERVPLLSDVLALARERGLRVYVELKRDAPSRAASVRSAARLLRAQDPRLPLLVTSFDPLMLAGFATLAPGLPYALLVSREPRYRPLVHAARPIGASAVQLERTVTGPRLVERLRAEGLAVHVWTVNDPREARDLAALGVDALTTDSPAEILAALA